MQKDVIYIDVEDDITAIIGKIKAAEHEIVALVPPKRTGAIQSAVNLKLVQRAAERADKHVVIISNNAALTALAGAAHIPVAKNLQSRPEIAEVPALKVDEDDDIIDGSAQGDDLKKLESIDSIESENATANPSSDKKVSPADAKNGKKKLPSIPDFNKFRKKFFLILAGVVLLIGGGIWAFVIAPHATIAITAQTSQVAVNTQVKASDTAATSLSEGTIKTTTKASETPVSKTIPATGTKDVGTKATGTIRVTPTRETISDIVDHDVTVAAGSEVSSSSGAKYRLDSALTFSYDTLRTTRNGVTVGVTAVENGSKYNGASGSAKGLSGFEASFTASTSGGTDKTVTVVQQSDIDSATANLVSDAEKDAAKKALQSQFGKDATVIDASFVVNTSGVSIPAAGTEAPDGKAAIGGAIKYSLKAIIKADLNTFLDAYFKQQIDGKNNQKVYSNGVSSVSLTNVTIAGETVTAKLTANGKIGPKIDEAAIKEYVKGKRIGEVQEYVKAIDGVKSVDVNFSPFWVHTVPGDTKKITVKFVVDE
ncbi:hypothetical protein HG436_001330 [Candidatus Saccharibacteria bacterium]|nr:hypothetical protein [Candidatus Saccharibacteria bacterium]